jgi:hypothetical protein
MIMAFEGVRVNSMIDENVTPKIRGETYTNHG